MSLSCEETVAMLSGFMDGELDPKICDDIRGHLEDCDDCRVVLDSFSKTITIYRHFPEKEVPEEIQIRITEYLKDKVTPDPENS